MYIVYIQALYNNTNKLHIKIQFLQSTSQREEKNIYKNKK
jgi:hypothetical protein